MENNSDTMIEVEEELRRQTPITTRVRILMKEKGITGRSIADVIGYTEAWFSQVMNNKRSLSVGELSKIAELLGVEMGDLCPKADEIKPPKTIDEIVDQKIRERLDELKK
jgi:transcriptional regulator with XRE-family HTH domain